MLPQLFLPHPPLLLHRLILHHTRPPALLPLRRHLRRLVAAPAEGGSGHWMRRLASAAAPSQPRAAAEKSVRSTLAAVGQFTGTKYEPKNTSEL